MFTTRVPAGTCPGCQAASHPGRTCKGGTTDQVYRYLLKLPETIYVPLVDRELWLRRR